MIENEICKFIREEIQEAKFRIYERWAEKYKVYYYLRILDEKPAVCCYRVKEKYNYEIDELVSTLNEFGLSAHSNEVAFHLVQKYNGKR